MTTKTLLRRTTGPTDLLLQFVEASSRKELDTPLFWLQAWIIQSAKFWSCNNIFFLKISYFQDLNRVVLTHILQSTIYTKNIIMEKIHQEYIFFSSELNSLNSESIYCGCFNTFECLSEEDILIITVKLSLNKLSILNVTMSNFIQYDNSKHVLKD